jgi:hypothetical protein
MLSSLLDQIQLKDMKIVMSIASLEDNGNPTTEKTVEYYKNQGLEIKHLKYTDANRFEYRGFIRNDQIKLLDEDTDWVLFADCDMVYDMMFFSELKAKISEVEDVPALYSVCRWSTDKDLTNQFFRSDEIRYPSRVLNASMQINNMLDPKMLVMACKDGKYQGDEDNVFEPSPEMPMPLKKMRSVGAGYFQLVARKYITIYVDEKSNRDKKMSKSFNPKSDMQFRKSIGKGKAVNIDMGSKQYHLNHDRDPDKGEHNREQR